MIRPQVLGHQRRPEALAGSFRQRPAIVGPDEREHSTALRRRVRAIRAAAHVAMDQTSIRSSWLAWHRWASR